MHQNFGDTKGINYWSKQVVDIAHTGFVSSCDFSGFWQWISIVFIQADISTFETMLLVRKRWTFGTHGVHFGNGPHFLLPWGDFFSLKFKGIGSCLSGRSTCNKKQINNTKIYKIEIILHKKTQSLLTSAYASQKNLGATNGAWGFLYPSILNTRTRSL